MNDFLPLSIRCILLSLDVVSYFLAAVLFTVLQAVLSRSLDDISVACVTSIVVIIALSLLFAIAHRLFSGGCRLTAIPSLPLWNIPM